MRYFINCKTTIGVRLIQCQTKEISYRHLGPSIGLSVIDYRVLVLPAGPGIGLRVITRQLLPLALPSVGRGLSRLRSITRRRSFRVLHFHSFCIFLCQWTIFRFFFFFVKTQSSLGKLNFDGKSTHWLRVRKSQSTKQIREKNLIFLIYEEIQSGAVAKSYIRKGFLIYEEMRKCF